MSSTSFCSFLSPSVRKNVHTGNNLKYMKDCMYIASVVKETAFILYILNGSWVSVKASHTVILVEKIIKAEERENTFNNYVEVK